MKIKTAVTVILISALIFCTTIPHDKIYIYTFYSPSHEVLLNDWFLPTLEDTIEVVVKKIDQHCPSGTYMQSGWTQTMLGKIDLIRQAILEHPQDIIVYADIDIQFFKPIEKDIREALKNCDLAVQKDSKKGAICAGFMALRANETTLAFFNLVRERMINNPGVSDQPTINQLLVAEKYQGIHWNFLPVTFFGTGTLSYSHFANKKTWQEGDAVIMPANIVLHHANYTTSIENKIKLLSYVRKQYNEPLEKAVMPHNPRKEARKQRIEERAKKRKNR